MPDITISEEQLDRMVRERTDAALRRAGVNPVPAKGDTPRKSPDGGPVSNGHTILKPHYVDTIQVIAKSNGRAIWIRPEHFNEEIHSRQQQEEEEETPRRRRVRQQVSSAPRSEHTEAELKTMPQAALRALPELAGQGDLPSNKDDLVAMILAARESDAGDGEEDQSDD